MAICALCQLEGKPNRVASVELEVPNPVDAGKVVIHMCSAHAKANGLVPELKVNMDGNKQRQV